MSVLGSEHTESVLTASRISPHWGQYHGLSLPSNSLATESSMTEGGRGGRRERRKEGEEEGGKEEGGRERGREWYDKWRGEKDGRRAMVESGYL